MPKPIIRSTNAGQLTRRRRDIKVRALVADTQIGLSCNLPQRFTQEATMSWEMWDFSGRESRNAVHTH